MTQQQLEEKIARAAAWYDSLDIDVAGAVLDRMFRELLQDELIDVRSEADAQALAEETGDPISDFVVCYRASGESLSDTARDRGEA